MNAHDNYHDDSCFCWINYGFDDEKLMNRDLNPFPSKNFMVIMLIVLMEIKVMMNFNVDLIFYMCYFDDKITQQKMMMILMLPGCCWKVLKDKLN